MEAYMTLLKSYTGRDKVLRTLGYSLVFVSGAFNHDSKAHKDLTTIAKQFSSCRTVLRLFDDIPMLLITKASFHSKEKDFVSKALHVLGNVSILTYFPFEKIAWLSDNEVIDMNSYPLWMAAISCWAIFLMFNILRNLRRICTLRKKRTHLLKARKLELPETPESSDAEIRKTGSEEAVEFLTLIKNAADIVMAINWLPPVFLWAGKISPSRNAFFGVISSLIGTALYLRGEAVAAAKAKQS